MLRSMLRNNTYFFAISMIWDDVEKRYGILTTAERAILRSRFPQLSAEEIEPYIPKNGKIVDLGCGRGELINYLDLKGFGGEFVGVDLSLGKIALAYKTMPVFRVGDVLQCEEEADCFIAIQLFYLLRYENQMQLVRQCYKHLRPGGVFLIGVLPNKFRTHVIHAFFRIPLPKNLESLRTKFFGRRDGGPYFRTDWMEFLSSVFDSVGHLPVKIVDGGCECFYVCTKQTSWIRGSTGSP